MTMQHGAAPGRVAQRFLCVAAGLLALVARPSHAADGYFSPTEERVRISLGAMHVVTATTLRVDSSTGGSGTQFNGERTFGLDKSDFEPKFQAMVRAGTRQRLTFDYFTLDRSGNTTLRGATPIIFRDISLQPGDPLQTHLSLRTLGMTYGYSFRHSETVEIAGTFGVHVMDISTMAKVQTQTRHILQTKDQAGPVPTLGIDATWVASRRFYFDGRAQYVAVRINNLSGSLGIFELDALYRYRPNVSFAVGYNQLRAHLSLSDSSKGGLFDLNTKGPQMFFRIAF
ncbi:MAG: hypothetical protein M3N97_03480 [Pseudomonadota bacterium]|nr:hypothetical protein [Pseudomonadota bacterium]